ncbi:MAG TPA: hypothetical protein VGM39_17415 [Kofleriaceae bacterium]
MRATIVLVVLAACGRIDFSQADSGQGVDTASGSDARACGTHDEDGDGVMDGCDDCPQESDPAQADADFDGVGDVCDPHISNPGDAIAFFDPFTSQDPGWVVNRPALATWDGDSVTLDSRNDSLDMERVLALDGDSVSIRGTLIDHAGQQEQIAIMNYSSTGGWVYCELYEDTSAAGSDKYSLTQTVDRAVFTSLQSESLDRDLGIENIQYRLEMLAERSGLVTCLTDWPVADDHVSGMPMAGLGGETVRIQLLSLRVRLDSYIQYHTQ